MSIVALVLPVLPVLSVLNGMPLLSAEPQVSGSAAANPSVSSSPSKDQPENQPKNQSQRTGKITGPTVGYSGSAILIDPLEEKARLEQQKALKDALALKRAGKLPEAEAAMTKLLADPSFYSLYQPIVLAELAPLYATLGNWEKSVHAYRTLIYGGPNKAWFSSRSNSAATRLQFALALCRVGQYEEARSNYNYGATVSHPENYGLPPLPQVTPQLADSVRLEILIHLGLATEFRNSDEKQAIPHARAAVGLSRSYGLSHLYLGDLLLKTGVWKDYEDAKAELQLALQFGEGVVKSRAAEYLKKLY